MDSDGAIVLTIGPATKATFRQLAHHHWPDALIAFCLGGIAGTVVDVMLYGLR